MCVVIVDASGGHVRRLRFMRIIGDEAGAMREHAGIARISYYYRRNRVGHTAGPRAWRGRRARVVQAELRKKHVRAVRSRCVCIILLSSQCG